MLVRSLNKAVFFDRDGTIITEREYLSSVSEVEISGGVVSGLQLLKENGFLLMLVSNQSGVARGFYPIDTVYEMNAAINIMLDLQHVMFDGIYFCPHLINGIVPEYSIQCECRKPGIKMALDAASDFNISLVDSYMVGDKKIDIEFGQGFSAAGNVLVATGYGQEAIKTITPDYFATNVLDAAKWIVSH